MKFQFHWVQLEAIIKIEPHSGITFQFHWVQLEDYVNAIKEVCAAISIPLGSIRRKRSNSVLDQNAISIPLGSIRRADSSYIPVMDLNFNSIGFN